MSRVGVAGFALAALLAAAPVGATGVALSDCNPPPEKERLAMQALAARLRDAVAKEKFRVLQDLLGDPLLVRLDGKKRNVRWEVIRDRFSDLFGPRVRQALAEGKVRKVGRHWVVGDRVVLMGLTQHGIACGLVVLAVFEEPPAGRR
jgi:hypothetical protein